MEQRKDGRSEWEEKREKKQWSGCKTNNSRAPPGLTLRSRVQALALRSRVQALALRSPVQALALRSPVQAATVSWNSSIFFSPRSVAYLVSGSSLARQYQEYQVNKGIAGQLADMYYAPVMSPPGPLGVQVLRQEKRAIIASLGFLSVSTQQLGKGNSLSPQYNSSPFLPQGTSS
ncbi:hypothetical protein STEG23_018683 [Scotinomys teguina]